MGARAACMSSARSARGLKLTAIVDKTSGNLGSTMSLPTNLTAASHSWRYSGAKWGAIVARPEIATYGGSLSTIFPANSVTLLGNATNQFDGCQAHGSCCHECSFLRNAIATSADPAGPQSASVRSWIQNCLVSSSIVGVRVVQWDSCARKPGPTRWGSPAARPSVAILGDSRGRLPALWQQSKTIVECAI